MKLLDWIIIFFAVLSITTLALILVGAPPVDAYVLLFKGAFASWRHFAHVLNVWIPLVICSCGLLFTFNMGLWNIGIEGQIMVGAIGSTFIIKTAGCFFHPFIVLGFALLCAVMCGALWAIAAGFLKIRGNVHEIFSGLGLNFVAQALILWLIFGPWKRPGIASMSGTEPFPEHLWFPVPSGWRVSPFIIFFTVVLFLTSAGVLRTTRWGLVLRAIGSNPRAAEIYGISVNRNLFLAMLYAGAFAGLVGFFQTTVIYHGLIPAISSNYGYLSLLIVMLAQYNWKPIPFIALIFAALQVGSIQLPLMLQIDSSLSGVIQGLMVLTALGVVYARRNRSG